MTDPDGGDDRPADHHETSGYEVAPERPLWLTTVLVALVVLAAAAIAHFFKESSQYLLELYAESRDPTRAATRVGRVLLFVIVAAAVIVAAFLGRFVDRRWKRHVGVEAVGSSARGEGRTISLRATLGRAAATWTVSTGLVSIGRESAIIESGGAIGAVAGKRSGGRGDALATAGIAAAFAAAYHAPVAAILYVEEHLGVRRSRRAITFALVGAVGGHLAAVELLGGHVIFPPTEGSRWKMLALGALLLVPAVLVARIFFQLRVTIRGGALARRVGANEWVGIAVLALVAGGAVAWYPGAAGNGMEALRHAAVAPTVSIAMALAVGKLIGTTASLGAGSPGGVLTPTISITSGAVLLILLGVEGLGWNVTDEWDVMVAAMAIGVAVGIRSPLVAVFLLPEMLGDYTLVPVTAVLVAAAVVVDRLGDRIVRRLGQRVPTGVYDEDA